MGALLGLPVLVLYARHAPGRARPRRRGLPLVHHPPRQPLRDLRGRAGHRATSRRGPLVNTAFLAVGAVLASIVGTTGASVLLIRPLLATNQERRYVAHTVVFFIFVVSNIGGCLTPSAIRRSSSATCWACPSPGRCGSRPTGCWPTRSCSPSTTSGSAASTRARARPRSPGTAREIRPIRVTGKQQRRAPVGGGGAAWPGCTRPIARSRCWRRRRSRWPSTARAVREANRFTFHAISEVAALFAGIFLTMLPALDILHARGPALGLARALAVLLGDGAALVVPRQRADLPDLRWPSHSRSVFRRRWSG